MLLLLLLPKRNALKLHACCSSQCFVEEHTAAYMYTCDIRHSKYPVCELLLCNCVSELQSSSEEEAAALNYGKEG